LFWIHWNRKSSQWTFYKPNANDPITLESEHFFVVSFAILLFSMVVIYGKKILGKNCLMSYKMNNETLTMKKHVECENFNIGDKNSNEVAQI